MARGADQHQNPQSDIQIAQAASMKRIGDIAGGLGIPDGAISPYGHYKAKVSLDYVKSLESKPNGKLILVTAITPTPAGEGKTTTTVGLGDALNHIGKKAIICRSHALPSRKQITSSRGSSCTQTSSQGWHARARSRAVASASASSAVTSCPSLVV